jgi:predicted transcriptional regulator
LKAKKNDHSIMSEVNVSVKCAHAITLAWLSNPNTQASATAVERFLRGTYATVRTLAVGGEGGPAPEQEETTEGTRYAPAVSVRKSLASSDFIVSMIDGKPYRSLGRHLSSRGLTPDEYRRRYNLKASYPMVAPGYRKGRSEQAMQLGLGRKPAGAVEKAVEAVAEPIKAVAKRARKSISEAKRAAQEHLGG